MANKFVETITSLDNNLFISSSSYTPSYYPDDNNLHDGSVRTNRGGLEYYDSKSRCWFPLPGADVKVELGPQIEMVLQWAYKKMDEEEKLKQLAEKYPALKQAKENYDIVKALVQNEVA